MLSTPETKRIIELRYGIYGVKSAPIRTSMQVSTLIGVKVDNVRKICLTYRKRNCTVNDVDAKNRNGRRPLKISSALEDYLKT